MVTDKNLYIFIKIWNFQYTATDLLKIIFCQKREAIEKENANVAFHHNNGVVSAVRWMDNAHVWGIPFSIVLRMYYVIDETRLKH